MSGAATFSDDRDPKDDSLAWELLSQKVGALVTAWEAGGDPPKLGDYLPDGRPAVQRLALAELIKVDLEYRWRHRGLPKTLEEYAVEFPELARSGLPADLIYEEYHVRKQAGDTVQAADYFDRFPSQAGELERLLGLEGPAITTALFASEKVDPVEVGDRIEDFDLLARLGKGAFASVFLARQRSMQRLVALKISADRGTEPQMMAQLDHPHIVRVFDQRLLPERKMRLLYMQYISGGTLQPVIELARQLPPSERSGKTLLTVIDGCLERRGESPPIDSTTRQRLSRASWPDVVCWIGARLASALDHAHRQGMLHRDVKPANVLVAADGTPKLADFNISCSTEIEDATPAAYFGGSLGYMSPEQLEANNPKHYRIADDLDGRSDVYSLGVLLWELLSGRRPFSDDHSKSVWPELLESMVAQRREGVPAKAIARLPPGLPLGLKDVLLKCLAPDAGDRYATAGELARQLELCLRPQVQRLLRPAASDWRTVVRRHPILTLSVAGILPNAVMSAVNIPYNKQAIIEKFGERFAAEIWNTQLTVWNLLFYSVATAVLLVLIWPVIRAVARSQRGGSIATDRLPALRRRCLAIGDTFFAVVLTAWLTSGLIFPTLIRLHVGPAEDLSAVDYFLQFGFSTVLCGLIAGTLGFFLITFLAVRAIYPALVRPDSAGDTDVDALARLSRRVWRYFSVSVAAPFLTVAVLALAVWMSPLNAPQPIDVQPTEVPQSNAQRWATPLMGGLGLVGFLVAFALARAIQSDLAALALAFSPTGEVLPEGSQTLDSFWSGSRR